MFIRNCPLCNNEIEYTNHLNYQKSLSTKKICTKCSHEKTYVDKVKNILSDDEFLHFDTDNIYYCPKCKNGRKCKNRLKYVSACIKKKLCYSCSKNNFISKLNDKERKKVFGRDTKGEKNPFFNKKHSNETKEKLSKFGKLHPNKPMIGKSVYSVWLKKYGKEIADQKMNEYKRKQSLNSAGKNNPMYGKPSPIGSGNGWSGWYKGWYFRSLLELSYMINIIERFNLKWKSAESQPYKVKYKSFDGKERTYFADFIINDKYVVECKPKKLMKSDLVIRKAIAAKKLFQSKGLIYKLVSVRKLSNLEVKELYDKKMIIFTKRYEQKMINL